MSTCHATCLTCSASTFISCLTCNSGLTLSYGTCNCDTNWQTQCSGQYMLRELIQFLDMFIKLYIVGVMLLYVLRARLPLSYRVWSGLNGLSLLIYNQVFFLQYEDQKCLQALSISNGPYFASFRVMAISTSHIFPTMVLIIIMLIALILLFYPVKAFYRTYQTVFQYVKGQGMHIFDCSYFFASRMMFFYIGKFIKQASGASVIYIVITGVYGLFILLAIIRNIQKYHQGTVLNHAYQTPIYLYTLLAPASLIGLGLATSEIVLVIVYCSPFALLILILLLNRNMKIFTKQNIKFFVTQGVMAGLTIAFIYLNDSIKTYILVGVILLSSIVITIQVWYLFTSGFDLGIQSSKIHPILDNVEDEPAQPKKIYGQQKDGYF